MDRFVRELLEKAEQAQRELTPQQQENRLWKSYDTLWGYLQSSPDLYARASLTEHLDNLLGSSLLSTPEHARERAETADLKTTSTREIGAVSTVASGSPSGKSQDATSRDPSYSPLDEDTGHR